MTRNIIVTSFAFLTFILSSFSSNAQEEKPLNEREKMLLEMEKTWVAPYELEIDKSIFNKKIMNTYTSSKYEQAAFMVIVFGESSYEEQKAKFAKKEPKEGETVISKKVEMLNGRETLIYKCKQTEDDLTFIFHIFTCKGDDNTVIMSSGSCKPEDESALEKTFEAAASSVKLKK